MAQTPTARGHGKPKSSSDRHKPRSKNDVPATSSGSEPSPGDGGSKPGVSPKPLPSGLVVVATPIGNAADISLRALDVLSRTDLVACEDTRVTAKLLARHGLRPTTQAYHEHNADKMRPKLIAAMQRGETVALVSDAGTPLVSDPGYKLVRACYEEGVPVTALPGPSSVMNALVLSGLPSDRFLFMGFLAQKTKGRRDALTEIAGLAATLVILESPKRLAASLADMAATLGPRPAAVTREMTKFYEEVRRGPLDELAEHYAQAGAPKGEITIVISPPDPAAAILNDAALDELLIDALKTQSVRDAAHGVTLQSGRPKRDVYARALALNKGEADGT